MSTEYLLIYLSLISFIYVLQFSVYKCFTSLVHLFLDIFILFDAITNGIFFLVSLSNSL